MNDTQKNNEHTDNLSNVLSKLNQTESSSTQSTEPADAQNNEVKEHAKDSSEAAVQEEKPKKAHHPASYKKRKLSRKEFFTAILGIVVCFFVVIGIISTATFAVNTANEWINSTKLKEEMAYVVFPLVIIDAPEFDSPEKLDSSVIISSSIWKLILEDSTKDKYIKDDVGGMTVPDTDVEYYVRMLYGNDVEIVHQTISDSAVEMSYDAESKSYRVESTPVLLPYTPRVDEIHQEGDIYTLKVSYILPDVTWSLSSNHKEIVEKVMEFKVKKVDDHYQILSLSMLEVMDAESSENAQTPDEASTDTKNEFLEETAESSQESSVSSEEQTSTEN